MADQGRSWPSRLNLFCDIICSMPSKGHADTESVHGKVLACLGIKGRFRKPPSLDPPPKRGLYVRLSSLERLMNRILFFFGPVSFECDRDVSAVLLAR